MHSVWARSRYRALACFALAAFAAGLLCRPALAGYASIVVDVGSGQVVHEANADSLNYPASLTKLMTLYLTFGAIRDGKLSMATRLTVSGDAASQQPTKLGLQEGEQVALQDLILGVITHSANDAAYVLGETLGGSEAGFAQMMTNKAHRIGMSSTTFQNPNGLPDPDQTTTARDLSRLAIALYRDFPEFYPLFSTPSFTFDGVVYNNFDHLLRTFPGADGLKTGYTHASGYNLATSAERDGRRLVGIVMGARSGGERDRVMEDLLNDAFAGRQSDDMAVADARPRSLEGRIIAHAIRAVESIGPIEADAAPFLSRHGRPRVMREFLARGALRPERRRPESRRERLAEERAAAREESREARADIPRRRGDRWTVEVGGVGNRGHTVMSDVERVTRGKPRAREVASRESVQVCRGRHGCDAIATVQKASAKRGPEHRAGRRFSS